MYLLFLAILILILLIFLFYYRNKIENNNVIDSQENFSNNDEIDLENFSNLINNGNFSNSNNISSYVNQNGYNKIIKNINPGKSSYVLNQRKSDNTFYEFSIDVDINSSYILYFWICLNSNEDIQEFDFEKYVKLRIPKKDFNNYLPKIIYNIIKKTEYNDKSKWFYIKCQFDTIENIQNKAFISLNFNSKFDNLFITDLSAYKVLPDAKNFIYNKDLIYYGDANTYQGHNTIFKDLTGNGNDIYFSSIPTSELSNGYIDLNGVKIEGFNSNEINNREFTIFMIINKQNDYPKINSLVNEEGNKNNKNIYEKNLLSLPGNNRYSFELLIENDHLVLKTDKNKIKSKDKLNYYNKASLVIIYKDGKMNIFNDGINIISAKIDKIYFNSNKFIINTNKNIDLFLYSLLIYQRIGDDKELRDLRAFI